MPAIRTLPSGSHGSVSYTRREAFRLLSLSLCGLLPGSSFGSALNHSDLISSNTAVGTARLSCLVEYFVWYVNVIKDTPREEEEITMVRHVLARGEGTSEWWESQLQDKPIAKVNIASDWKIEDSDARAHGIGRKGLRYLFCFDFHDFLFFFFFLFVVLIPCPDSLVNFANRDLHIFKVIPSATQEEVLFSIRSELFPFILTCPRMEVGESMVAHGAVRHSTYSGYLNTFEYKPGYKVLWCDETICDHHSHLRSTLTNQG